MQWQKYRWPLSCTRVLEQMTIVGVLRARIQESVFSSQFRHPRHSPLAHPHIHSTQELQRVSTETTGQKPSPLGPMVHVGESKRPCVSR
jgi:hypothetical protein